ncbi:ComEA family DNA-binding protein [Gordonia sp. (in: high G+C Gram-positive bacteria)]|uniref:ComEA family DNA-binding protein n=1 Tax=Gordonia sp. (in: high G+C Gram-positive bacteria) TaxID=84139 RepID=UPI003F9C3018
MGMELRAGRNRDSGPDRLARLIKAPDDEWDEVRPESDDVVDRWGATAMPDWLDTRQGRRTWNARSSEGFDCLDDTLDDASLDDDASTDDEDDEWDPPRRRWTMMPPAAIGLILVGVLGCGFAGYSLLRQNEPSTPLVAFDAPVDSSGAASSGAAPPTPGTDTPEQTSARPPSAEVVVSVVGLVRRPGLVKIPADSRVADALARAGGARANADTMSLNLAQIVHDGDQVLVGKKGDDQVRSAVVASGGSTSSPGGSSGTGSGTAGGSSSSGQLVNVNTATESELDTLPGVGPVTAQSIIAWREANGSFGSVDQLAEVDGIGEGRLAKLRPLVTVG